MNQGTAWKAAGAVLLVAAAGAGAAFAQSGIATAPGRATVNPAAPASEPEVAGPSTTTVRTGGPAHKARHAHKAASGAASGTAR